MTTTQIAYETKTARPYDQAVESCREALVAEGFGVLTEVDLQATLKKRLDVDIGPYLILGACHPTSAHRALTAVPEIGVLLPCNVTVSVEGGTTIVRAMNPEGTMGVLDDPAVGEVAVEVGQRLRRVIAAIG